MGQKITHLRRLLGMQQLDLATQLGVWIKRLADWEKDRSTPTEDAVSKLHKLAGKTILSFQF